MLSFLLHHWLFIFIFVVFAFVMIGATAALEAYLDFRKRPHEEMFWCHQHGYFRKVHCLPLFPELGGSAQNSFICPTCYYEKVFKEPNMRMN